MFSAFLRCEENFAGERSHVAAISSALYVVDRAGKQASCWKADEIHSSLSGVAVFSVVL
jgi:hypothetical protein